MNKKQVNQLIEAYEELFEEFVHETLWLLNSDRDKEFKFAVHNSVSNLVLCQLEEINSKLIEFGLFPSEGELQERCDG
tara:strand:- start:518 stop:751 length:234 start_codon:yes stop_codon:yes gene_type:complete